MSEGVKILISADDQASKVLANVADNVEQKVKRIKDVGRNAKSSTEFIGSLSNALGGSQLGSYASSLAQLTEKISAFSEVSKAGGAGALAFKAGIAAVVAVGAYKIGEAIGNAVFETKRWKDELIAAEKAATQLDAAVLKASSRRFGLEKQELDLLDGDAQVAEAQRMMDQLEAEIIGKKKQIQDKLHAEEDFNTAWFGSPEDRAKLKDTSELEAHLALLRDQWEELHFANSERAKAIDLQKQENDLKKRNADYIKGLQEEVDLLKASKKERASVLAMQKAGGDAEATKRIESLLREKEALEAKATKEKEVTDKKKKDDEDKRRDAERISDLSKKELNNLEAQRIELEKGKEAAHAFRLEKEGLSKDESARIAKEQSELDTAKKMQEFKKPENQAVQSRLLTRGPMEKGIDKVAKATERTAKTLDEIKREWLAQSQGSKSEMVFVGGGL